MARSQAGLGALQVSAAGTARSSVCFGKAILGGQWGCSLGAGSGAGRGCSGWAAPRRPCQEVVGWSGLRFLERLLWGAVAAMAQGKGTWPGGPGHSL